MWGSILWVVALDLSPRNNKENGMNNQTLTLYPWHTECVTIFCPVLLALPGAGVRGLPPQKKMGFQNN